MRTFINVVFPKCITKLIIFSGFSDSNAYKRILRYCYGKGEQLNLNVVPIKY